jgi:hypothetical protein
LQKDIALVILRNIIFLAVIFLIYSFGYAKFSSDIKEQVSLNEKYRVIYAELLNFVKLNENMYETKKRIEDIIKSIPMQYEQNQALNVKYKDRVLDAAAAGRIKVSDYSLSENKETGTITMAIDFNAGYEALYKFLFSIEMFSKVQSFSVNENGEVVVFCSPVLYSLDVDNYFSGVREKRDDFRTLGYFKELFDKSSKILLESDHVPSWRDITPEPQNPFYEYIPPKKSDNIKRPVVVGPKLPEIKISGVMYDSENPIVIIEGKLYRKGDNYKNVKITDIRERDITVTLEDKKYIIKFNRED